MNSVISKKSSVLPANFVVIDVETSGLDPKRHSILSIGAVTAYGKTFYLECQPREESDCDPCAMAVNGMDWEACKKRRLTPSGAVLSLSMWLTEQAKSMNLLPDTRWIMGGKNPRFDYEFMLQSLTDIWPDERDCAKELKVSRRVVDLHSLAYGWALREGIDFSAREFTTDVIYALLGFAEEPKPHNAYVGAKLEMDVFRKLFAAQEEEVIHV